MKSISLLLSAIMFITSLAPAFAASAEEPTEAVGWYGKEYIACGDKMSTGQITDCILAAAERWDKRLNAAYQKLMAQQPKEQQDRMRAAERAWVQFRDANCDYYINIPGTRANYIYAECRRVLTAQRAIELEAAARPVE
ncbi:MAG: lysozyme inhibitor LprI family protein [Pseudomonadota bacterium]